LLNITESEFETLLLALPMNLVVKNVKISTTESADPR
jgi:hypothetical protein